MQSRTRVRVGKAQLSKIGNICDIDHVSSLPYTLSNQCSMISMACLRRHYPVGLRAIGKTLGTRIVT